MCEFLSNYFRSSSYYYNTNLFLIFLPPIIPKAVLANVCMPNSFELAPKGVRTLVSGKIHGEQNEPSCNIVHTVIIIIAIYGLFKRLQFMFFPIACILFIQLVSYLELQFPTWLNLQD